MITQPESSESFSKTLNSAKPQRPEILFVGEAWGQNEQTRSVQTGHPCPFVGKFGFFLFSHAFRANIVKTVPPENWPGLLRMDAMWKREFPHIRLTNVFQQRPGPQSDNLENLCCARGADACLDLPPLSTGLFLRREHRHHLDRLAREIETLRPNLVVLLGATALWAVLRTTSIATARGVIHQGSPLSSQLESQKFLATYHPAAIFRRYSLSPIFQADLQKARIESQSRDFSRLSREIWTNPTIADLWRWWDLHGKDSPLLSIDIETVRQSLISEVGFAASPTCALHIPFILEDKRTHTFKSFWPTPSQECEAWRFVRHVCESPIPKIGQNILYDIQYLLWKAHIFVRNLAHDTMLQHHALFPGMEKGLGFLASIYCNEPQYKFLRQHSNKDEE